MLKNNYFSEMCNVEIIFHRRNKISQLLECPSNFGVEVDIRSNGRELIIHHDPFSIGELFEEWLANYEHGRLILNVKEEGLEETLLKLMKKYSIENFFFLDQSFPHLVKTASNGESRCAVRVSEFESLETALALSGKIEWIWVDFFTHFPLDYQKYQRLKNAGFKLCLVSPELQGFSIEAIKNLQEILRSRGLIPDAVCTKVPNLW